MAAPPPYWKKKTRPCPFYSQGRCLFSDACNFVHSVKVTHEVPPASPMRLESGVNGGGGGVRDIKSPLVQDNSSSVGRDEKRWEVDTDAGADADRTVTMSTQTPVPNPATVRSSSRSSRGSLSRTPSEKRRRVVLMSPPRSPRLSGLLSVLEPLIGPDVEEVEVSDEEDEGEEERDGEAEEENVEEDVRNEGIVSESVLALETEPSPSLSTVTHSSGESISLAYYQDSPALTSIPEEQDSHVSPSDHPRSYSLSTSSTSHSPPSEENEEASAHADSDFTPTLIHQAPSPQRPTLRSRIPSPIITQHLDRNDQITTTTIALDDNTLEVYSHSLHQNHPSDHRHSGHQQPNHTPTPTHNHFYATTDDPLTPSRGSRRHSTFELLTSPFTSPAQRILSLSPLSPKIFPAVDPTSPVFSHGALAQHHNPHQSESHHIDEVNLSSRRPYADDDMDSLETLETSETMGSLESSNADSTRPSSSFSFGHHDASRSDETSITVDSYEAPLPDEKLEDDINEDDDIGSPHETERPSSEYFRTPRNGPSTHVQAAIENEIENLPPLTTSTFVSDDRAETKEHLSRTDASDVEIVPSTASTEQEYSNFEAAFSPRVISRDEVPDESHLVQDRSAHSEESLLHSPEAMNNEREEVVSRLPSDQALSPRLENAASPKRNTGPESAPTRYPTIGASSEMDRDPKVNGSHSRAQSQTATRSEPLAVETLDEAQRDDSHEQEQVPSPHLEIAASPGRDTERECIQTRNPTIRASSETDRGSEIDGSRRRAQSQTTPRPETVSSQTFGEAQRDESHEETLVHHESGEFKQYSPRKEEEESVSILDDLMQDFQDSPGSAKESGEMHVDSIHSIEANSSPKPQTPTTAKGSPRKRISSAKAVTQPIPRSAEGASRYSEADRSELDNLNSPEKRPLYQIDEEFERQLPKGLEEASESVREFALHDHPETPAIVGAILGELTDTSRVSAATLQRTSIRLAPIATSGTRSNSLESPATLSFGPSPVTPDCISAHVLEAVPEAAEDESGSIHETILQRRAKHTSGSPKRLSVVPVTSPTKELRESFFPESLERTVRPSPSPLYEDSQHSASDSVGSSSSVSSPRPSWAELQKRSGVSSKVPFGFRQSLLMEESSSLARKLASQFSCDSSTSRTGSTSSLSPTSAFQPRRGSRVDMLSGRARSVSPALIGPGPSSYRHSVSPHSNSAPSLRAGPSTAMPRSASQAEFFADRDRADSPVQIGDPGPSSSARRASWMKPLRLSQVYTSSDSPSRRSSSLSQTNRLSTSSVHSSQAHVRNTSQGSVVQNTEPSSSRSSLISSYLNYSSIPVQNGLTILPGAESTMPSMESVLANSTPVVPTDRIEPVHRHSQSTGTVDQETGSVVDLLSPLSGSMRGLNFEELSRYQWPDSSRNSVNGDVTLFEDIPPNQTEPPTSYHNTSIPPTSLTPAAAHVPPIPAPCHAIATPRPTLMFAIASDNPAEVERVLASGEARPNDVIGPQSALEFALTNDALVNKTEIVKTLLAFGADVSSLPPALRSVHDEHPPTNREEDDILTDLPSERTSGSISKRKKRESALNPAMKYYLNRATAGPQAAQPSAALKRSDFRSLARMRFDFIGQDRALEHLYWVLGMHSQQPIGTPLVVLCCGPCGHGKSLLARKFGSLLNVPTHTVNMTVLKTSHDLWQCPSMSPYDPPSDRTLAEFLGENAGKRCVVVLDEIDKNEDERTLWSLLAPWELGRCSIDAGRMHIDVRNVIWLGTSNIGQDLVFEHHAARKEPDTVMSKAEYRGLMNSLRPLVTEKLGTSLMSRVTAVLPFVPFTPEEKLAIASEAILALGGEDASELTPDDFEQLALRCIPEYVDSDGARSLYRSVSTHLMEAL